MIGTLWELNDNTHSKPFLGGVFLFSAAVTLRKVAETGELLQTCSIKSWKYAKEAIQRNGRRRQRPLGWSSGIPGGPVGCHFQAV